MNDDTPEWNLPNEIEKIYLFKKQVRDEKKKLEEREEKLDEALADYENMYIDYLTSFKPPLDKVYCRTDAFELSLRKDSETLKYKLPAKKFQDALIDFINHLDDFEEPYELRRAIRETFLSTGFLAGKIIFKTKIKNKKRGIEFKFK